MALKATLKLEGKSYDIRDLNYELSKPYDNNYKPSASPQGGIINFTLLTPMDKNFVFHEWLLSVAEVKSGEFLLPLTHGIKHVERILSFERAYCIHLQESYSNYGSSQMSMNISISATIIKFSDAVTFLNKEFPG